jgi:pimeloyl-ACP methyl ester carboxylesterase
LLIVGELDAKFTSIARAMLARLPNARLALVPDAGHTLHLEQPAAFDDVVMMFMSNCSA